MKILSSASFAAIKKDYKACFGLTVQLINSSGVCVSDAREGSISHLPVVVKARQAALKQGVQWGEANVFYLAPGVISWVVPVVDGDTVLGGIIGGELLSDIEDREVAINYLAGAGYKRDKARRFVMKLTIREQSLWSADISYLYDLVYAVSGYKPRLLNVNRENAQQQREIAEDIQDMKVDVGRLQYTLNDERILLSLMRVGDRSGARRVLNRMLASIFLYSPRPAIVRARAIEMIGYLTRSAVEDNPLQDHLIERHLGWIDKLIHADGFEELCIVVRDTLDDFMNSIMLHGYNRSSTQVQGVLDYLSKNFMTHIALDDLVAEMGISRSHICHLVKQHTGKTVNQHIRTMRLQKACELLADSSIDYSDMAYELGFNDQSYFIKQFRETMGVTPAKYRRGLADVN
ncbi:MAG: helix-turn-helix transcriptional regulator [Kiritimatiellae bacterium]|nr:helix-turn-helix transcriptional regulator [Kiritimatiellia bacterium]